MLTLALARMDSAHSDSTLAISEQSSHGALNLENSTTQNPGPRTRSEAKSIPPKETSAPDLPPKRGTKFGPANLQRSHSYGNGYGCTTFNGDEEITKDAEKG